MKSTNHLAIQQLARLIDESLVLLKQASIDEPYPQSMDAPVASLLDQCLALCEQHHSILQEPLRVIYHFGLPVDSTLLASVATLANTCVLREIDLHANVKSFDRHALTAKSISECYISNIENNVFEPNALLTHLASLQQQCHQRGQRLLLCHNPHALPVVDDNLFDLSTSLPQHFSVQALIVVADPVDSYASYCASSSMDKTLDFESYCQRTLNFIETHSDLTIIRHEDFVSAPNKVMQQLCTVFDLPFNEDFLLLREAFLSNETIEPFIENLKSNEAYLSLCKKFGYFSSVGNHAHEFSNGIVSYAQNFEDVMLWRALHHVKNGFYIDVGAQDPIVDSVSKAFYENGWRGIHVEPIHEYAEALRSDRPDECVIEAILAAEEGNQVIYQILQSGLSTCSKEFAERHQQIGWKVTEVIVSSATLESIFCKAGKDDIHWMKIDVEGMEEDVLRGWKNHPARPWIVVIEATEPNCQTPTWQQWENHLLARDYQFVYFDGLNRFYIHCEHSELNAVFKVLPNCFIDSKKLKYTNKAPKKKTFPINTNKISSLHEQTLHTY